MNVAKQLPRKSRRVVVSRDQSRLPVLAQNVQLQVHAIPPNQRAVPEQGSGLPPQCRAIFFGQAVLKRWLRW